MKFGLLVNQPTWWGHCPKFVLGLLNSVGNINTAESMQKKTECNLLADQKGLHNFGHVFVSVIHPYLYIYCMNTHIF